MKKYIFIVFVFGSMNVLTSEAIAPTRDNANLAQTWKNLNTTEAQNVWNSLNLGQQRKLIIDLFKIYQNALKACFREDPFGVLFGNCDECLQNLPNIDVTFNQPVWGDQVVDRVLKIIFKKSFSEEEFDMLMNVHDKGSYYFAKLREYANSRNRLLKNIARTQDLIEILQGILIKEDFENRLHVLCTGDTFFSKSLKKWILKQAEEEYRNSINRDLFHSGLFIEQPD